MSADGEGNRQDDSSGNDADAEMEESDSPIEVIDLTKADGMISKFNNKS